VLGKPVGALMLEPRTSGLGTEDPQDAPPLLIACRDTDPEAQAGHTVSPFMSRLSANQNTPACGRLIYLIHVERQLYVEVNAERFVVVGVNEGSFDSTWPDPPSWRSGTARRLAASWPAAGHRLAVYCVCALAAGGPSPSWAAAQTTIKWGAHRTGARCRLLLTVYG
jgi:hypothetical protein